MKASEVIAGLPAKAETFEVRVANGEVGSVPLMFRYPASADEYAGLRVSARKFARMVRDRAPDAWKPYLPLSEEMAAACWWVHALGVDPTWSQMDVLMATRDAPALIPFLHTSIMTAIGATVARLETEEIESLGEPSEPTCSDATT